MSNFFSGVWKALTHPVDEAKWYKDIITGDTKLHEAGGSHQRMMNKVTVPILGDNKLSKNSDAAAAAIVGSIFAAPAMGAAAGGSSAGAAGTGAGTAGGISSIGTVGATSAGVPTLGATGTSAAGVGAGAGATPSWMSFAQSAPLPSGGSTGEEGPEELRAKKLEEAVARQHAGDKGAFWEYIQNYSG